MFLIDNVPYISINRMFDGVKYKRFDSIRQAMITSILTNGLAYKMFTFATTSHTGKQLLGNNCFHMQHIFGILRYANSISRPN